MRLALFNRVEITEAGRHAASLVSADDTGPSRSIELAFHTLNNGRAIIRANANLGGLQETMTVLVSDLVRADQLLTEAFDHVDKMRELIERTNTQIEETTERAVREHHYATQVEEANSKLAQQLIDAQHELAELQGLHHEAAIAEGA